MGSSRKSKKGMTLVELSVVLAVVAVISSMVISFSVLISRRSSAAGKRLDVMEDTAAIQTVVENWVDGRLTDGVGFLVADGGLTAGEQTLTFDISTSTLKGTVPDGDDFIYYAQAVKNVTFEVINSTLQENSDFIIFCTLSYGDGEKFTFTVNPFIGDVYETSEEVTA
jgi:prepilin-type N-terminal cleavage/methylation domain-containing protein